MARGDLGSSPDVLRSSFPYEKRMFCVCFYLTYMLDLTYYSTVLHVGCSLLSFFFLDLLSLTTLFG